MIKLNLGGGKHWQELGWSNLDKSKGYNLNFKILKPYYDNSVDLIYSSHFIEHIPEKNIILLLKDCYRVLKRNGVIRLVFPSTDAMQDLIDFNLKSDLIRTCDYYKRYPNRSIGDDVEELLGFIGSTGHESILSVSEAMLLLKLSGFTKIYRSFFNKSMVDEWNNNESEKDSKGFPLRGFDSREHILISNYIEAVR